MAEEDSYYEDYGSDSDSDEPESGPKARSIRVIPEGEDLISAMRKIDAMQIFDYKFAPDAPGTIRFIGRERVDTRKLPAPMRASLRKSEFTAILSNIMEKFPSDHEEDYDTKKLIRLYTGMSDEWLSFLGCKTRFADPKKLLRLLIKHEKDPKLAELVKVTFTNLYFGVFDVYFRLNGKRAMADPEMAERYNPVLLKSGRFDRNFAAAGKSRPA